MTRTSSNDQGETAEAAAARFAAEAETLRAENAHLRAQLAAQPARTPMVPVHRFAVSEGERQELELYGVATVGGRLMSTEEVRKAAAAVGLAIEIKDAAPGLKRELPVRVERGGVYGVDYVYPSVAPGLIDPAVAGTPGISGPAATEK